MDQLLTQPLREDSADTQDRRGACTRMNVQAPRASGKRSHLPRLLASRVKSESGQGVVEFAAVLPLLAMVIWAFILFGKAIYYYVELTHVANEGARLAAVNQPQSGSNLKQVICNQFGSGSELYKGSGTVTPAAVTVSYPGGSQVVGQPVQVDVSTSYHWFPFMNLADITIDGKATMRIEQDTTGNSFITGGSCS